MIFIIYIFLICIYFFLPFPLQLVVLCANTFIPDPIPFVDEFFMWLGFARKLVMVFKIGKLLNILAGLAILAAAGYGIYYVASNYILV